VGTACSLNRFTLLIKGEDGMSIIQPLMKEEVIKAIEHKNPKRVPMLINLWLYDDTLKSYRNKVDELIEKYPYDISLYIPTFPGYYDSPLKNHPEYKWIPQKKHFSQGVGIDSRILVEDWESLEQWLDKFPNPYLIEIMDDAKVKLQKDDKEGYRLGHFWFFFYERLWSFRGMENALTDFYLYPDEINKLFRALCDFYKVIVRRCKKELDCHGIYVTDDLGTQKSVMFSPSIFRKFFKPFYKEIIDECHALGMHFWLHTCGNVTEFMDDFIDIGIDVIHPIQKYSMNEAAISDKYSGKICFLAGMDMQYTLVNGSPDDVRKEVRFLMDTFDTETGGMMITCGNGITDDVPVENLEAFYDEAYCYGVIHRNMT
jgi:uroporphyrinogen decarboxylase